MSHNSRTFAILAVLALLVLSTLACSLGGITIGGGKATVNVNLNEDQLNDLLARQDTSVTANGDKLLTRVDRVDMHDGYLTIYGDAEGPNGETVSGSYDLSLSAEDGVLVAQIIAVNVPGVSLDDPRIAETNEDLSRELSEVLTESQGDVTFEQATVTEDELKLVVEVDIRR